MFSIMQLNADDTFSISKNDYDELSQLSKKYVHKNTGSSQYLYNTSYTYNIRGWMTSMENEDKDNSTLFNMELMYNDNIAKPQHNGNISVMEWRSPGSTIHTYLHI